MEQQRTARSREDLQEAMREQLLLLLSYCEEYDKGQRAFAKPTAATLRLLIHQTRNSHSLLDQLGLRSGRFYAVSRKLDFGNLTTECGLLGVQLSNSERGHSAAYMPKLGPLTNRDRLAFAEWWVSPVLRGLNDIRLSRKDIVTAVADTDGGAHVDRGLKSVYASFRDGDLLGWENDPIQGLRLPILTAERKAQAAPAAPFVNSPQYPCIRTIAHEFLLTMTRYAPWSLPRPYVPPVPDAPADPPGVIEVGAQVRVAA